MWFLTTETTHFPTKNKPLTVCAIQDQPWVAAPRLRKIRPLLHCGPRHVTCRPCAASGVCLLPCSVSHRIILFLKTIFIVESVTRISLSPSNSVKPRLLCLQLDKRGCGNRPTATAVSGPPSPLACVTSAASQQSSGPWLRPLLIVSSPPRRQRDPVKHKSDYVTYPKWFNGCRILHCGPQGPWPRPCLAL